MEDRRSLSTILDLLSSILKPQLPDGNHHFVCDLTRNRHDQLNLPSIAQTRRHLHIELIETGVIALRPGIKDWGWQAANGDLHILCHAVAVIAIRIRRIAQTRP